MSDSVVSHAFLMGKALRMLSMREFSATELQTKLQKYTADASAIQAVIQDLQRRNWQSDARYVAQKIHQRASRYGSKRILYELSQNVEAPDLMDEAQQELSLSEEERLFSIWQKKFGTLAATPKEHAKQMRFLLYRGFSSELIYKVFAKIKKLPTDSLES